MRILLMTWACDLEDVSEPGVSARWVKELAKDHDITLFAVSKPERFGCVERQFPGLEVIEWRDIPVPACLERFRAIVKPGYWPYYFRARRFLKALLRRTHFDVIHHLSPFAWRYPSPAAGLGVPLVRGPVAGGLRTPAGLRGMLPGRLRPLALLRTSDRLRLILDRQLRFSYRHTDHLLMAAPYMAEFLRPLPLGQVSIEIELGMAEMSRPEPRQAVENVTDRFRMLFVGRVVATKGVRFAIRALGEAACRSTATLTVVGDGDDLAACRAEVARLGLQQQVKFCGWCDRDRVAQHYRGADAFVFPSYREPTGGVLLEAMAQGLPLIVCAYGGPDHMVDESCGIKVAPCSEQEYVRRFAQAIDRLASDRKLRERMGEHSRVRARDGFAWTAKRQRLGALYARLAGAPGTRPESGPQETTKKDATTRSDDGFYHHPGT